jgi:hypothetical protein
MSIDSFNDLWDAMTIEQKHGVSWLATYRDPEGQIRTLGSAETKDEFLGIAVAAIDSMAKYDNGSYESYADEVVASLKGIGKGLLDGGIHHYLEYKRPPLSPLT